MLKTVIPCAELVIFVLVIVVCYCVCFSINGAHAVMEMYADEARDAAVIYNLGLPECIQLNNKHKPHYLEDY